MDPSAFQRETPDVGDGEPAEDVRPFVLSPTGRMALMVGMGVVGGGFLAKVAVEHMFSKGLTKDERKNILAFGGISALLLASKVFFGIDEETATGGAFVQKGVEAVADAAKDAR